MVAQALIPHSPYRVYDKFPEIATGDVIWDNLGLNPYEKRVRMAISYAITVALLISRAIPVAFLSIIPSIEGLCKREILLALLCLIASLVLGIIQGKLQHDPLAVLMLPLPIVLRLLGRLEGIPIKSGLELSLMTRYSIFQVIVGTRSPSPWILLVILVTALALDHDAQFALSSRIISALSSVLLTYAHHEIFSS
ncbi:hypothetical protein BV22DRAFT_706542 [Leucogyrophana mollusca]|uniref:Uncharacterized protein n=1 Tax=Leucogyrophana mollusca TaxID=85980 RepID=A0ACB8B803_9AGAM|nr:hypothetical protein BV22DRAFT_706542 [Leucogyrophana mollusca]